MYFCQGSIYDVGIQPLSLFATIIPVLMDWGNSAKYDFLSIFNQARTVPNSGSGEQIVTCLRQLHPGLPAGSPADGRNQRQTDNDTTVDSDELESLLLAIGGFYCCLVLCDGLRYRQFSECGDLPDAAGAEYFQTEVPLPLL